MVEIKTYAASWFQDFKELKERQSILERNPRDVVTFWVI